MNRTLLLKVVYPTAAIALIAAALVITPVFFPGREVLGLFVVALVAFVPGRMSGFIYRDLLRARRLLDLGLVDEGLRHLELALARLHRRPWQRRILWLSWSFYTTDAEAMVWHNIGVAQLRRGKKDEARDAYSRALALDPKYPLPHFNLAMIAYVEGDDVGASAELRRARALGYRETSTDDLIRATQSLYARLEGRGPSPG